MDGLYRRRVSGDGMTETEIKKIYRSQARELGELYVHITIDDRHLGGSESKVWGTVPPEMAMQLRDLLLTITEREKLYEEQKQ